MSEKRYGVALFYSTKVAMAAEKRAKQEQLNVRIIPTPEKIHASCGFCLRYDLNDEKALTALLASDNISSEGLYDVTQTGLKIEVARRT